MAGFTGLQIARSGLYASERALYVTGHNLSNVNTAGYTRQQIILSDVPGSSTGYFRTGLGASIDQVRQIRNEFLDNVFRAESELAGYEETRLKTLDDVQSIIGEPMTAGVQAVMNQFWDGLQELSKDPGSLNIRALLRQRADAFVNQVNHVGDQLSKLQDDLNSEIRVRINEINSLSRDIANLNMKILRAEGGGKDQANDLKDQRANDLDRLSKLINISINPREDGMVDVDVAGSYLVSDSDAREMYAGENVVGSTYVTPVWSDSNNPVSVRGGILKGLLEARGELVVGSINSVSNGSPAIKSDITFAIDLSDAAGINSLNQVDAFGKTNLSKFIDQLENKGIDYKFNLITYGGTPGADLPQTFANRAGFEAAVAGLATRAGGNSDFFSVISRLQNDVTYRTDANRYLINLTDQTVQGAVVVNAATLQTQINTLRQLGMTTFVATAPAFIGDTNPEPGWQEIANQTGGKIYDVTNVDYTAFGTDIDTDMNQKISTFPGSLDIIPESKRKLNAFINIMAREINSVNKTGLDLYGNPGEDFFVKIDNNLPMQMGNIQVNPNFSELSKIVAAKTTSKGDNSLVEDILSLRQSTFFGDATQKSSGDNYYRSFVLELGNSAAEASRAVDGQNALVQAADSQRSSISSVSMDEEMSNMIKYQYSYNAAAKVINLMDDFLDVMINKIIR
jgi:flagellar hook-associated protein 1 FlgK